MQIKCNKCAIEKDISKYHKDNRRKLGVQTICKDCVNQRWVARSKRKIPELNHKDLVALLDYDKETGFFTWKQSFRCGVKAGDRAGSFGAHGYRYVSIKSIPHKEHRLAWFYVNGSWPSGEIDHVNHIRTDNRIENLRDVGHYDNQRNMKMSRNNTSGYTGVYVDRDRNCYFSYIGHGKNRHYLGRFSNIQEAIAARKEKERELGYHENHGK